MSRLGRASVLLALLAVGTCARPGAARADGPRLDLQLLHPPATFSPNLGLDTPGVLPHLRAAAGLFVLYGHDALVLRDGSGKVIPGGELVANQLWVEAVGSIGLWDRFELGTAVPVAAYQGGDGAPPGTDLLAEVRGERGAGLGDLRLDAKGLIADHVFGGRAGPSTEPMRRHRLRLALLLGVTFPTATTALAGDRNVTGRPRVALDWSYCRFRLTAEVGAIFRERERLLDLDVTHQLSWGLGVSLNPWRSLSIMLEGRGLVGVAPPRGGKIDAPEAPVELDLGLSFGSRIGLHPYFGGGIGLGHGYGVPTGRALFGLRFIAPAYHKELPWAERDDDHDGILNATDRCVREAGPPENGGCPDTDRDRDGVIDRLDRCPDLAGVAANGGCPDEDSDGDGVPDRLDRCPAQPGPASTEGCPPKDSDGDGVPDVVDRCPDTPGVRDNDGCPDTDSDGDGLVDRLDKCPFEAEVYNGVRDEDGCPDAGAALADVQAGRIALFEPIVFDTTGLTARSKTVIAAVGALLRAHTEIKRVRIDGHTDNRGSPILNLDLSLKRARLVRSELVDHWKIDPNRITAQGFGSNRPLADNATIAGRARNRRIEITILEGPRLELPR
jgi:outer membrane protein OmpA-like peptidoglycan-associated protein